MEQEFDPKEIRFFHKHWEDGKETLYLDFYENQKAEVIKFLSKNNIEFSGMHRGTCRVESLPDGLEEKLTILKTEEDRDKFLESSQEPDRAPQR